MGLSTQIAMRPESKFISCENLPHMLQKPTPERPAMSRTAACCYQALKRNGMILQQWSLS